MPFDANALKPYLPPGGRAQVLVTSNAHAWRGIAAPVEIRVWPKKIGADYLIARTGRETERNAALVLSESLGGLPLAHEQAAAYCERLDVTLTEYTRRFEATPTKFLDDTRHAPAEYHDGLTVAKTFGLAIDEAAKLHPAAEPLIVHVALLAPEPIPLFLFLEGREKFGEPLASALADGELDEAVAALRSFALLDREMVQDERDPTIITDCIRLHRLVREVAATRVNGEKLLSMRHAIMAALNAVYPQKIFKNPKVWSRARRLDRIAIGMVGTTAKVMISYTIQDAENVELLRAALGPGFSDQVLLDHVVGDADVDPELLTNPKWAKPLYDSISRCRAVLLVISESSLQSKWCFAEFVQARTLGKAIFPVVMKPRDARGVLLPEDIEIYDYKERSIERLRHALTQALLAPERTDV
jgi:hypothetical protein